VVGCVRNSSSFSSCPQSSGRRLINMTVQQPKRNGPGNEEERNRWEVLQGKKPGRGGCGKSRVPQFMDRGDVDDSQTQGGEILR